MTHHEWGGDGGFHALSAGIINEPIPQVCRVCGQRSDQAGPKCRGQFDPYGVLQMGACCKDCGMRTPGSLGHGPPCSCAGRCFCKKPDEDRPCICNELDERCFIVMLGYCEKSAVAAVRTSHGGKEYREGQALVMATLAFAKAGFPIENGWGWMPTVCEVRENPAFASIWRNAMEHEGNCYFSY